ncbi:MAG: gp436 family protein [Desulfobulbus sp.]
MVAYCTLDDLTKLLPEDILVQLTDDDGIGVVNDSRIAEAIDTAGSEIDGWCAPKYVVPFDPVPALVKKCAIDVAIYNLYSRRVETIPETRSTRYKEAMRLLKDIATGLVRLETAQVEARRTEGILTVSAPERLFPHDLLEKM